METIFRTFIFSAIITNLALLACSTGKGTDPISDHLDTSCSSETSVSSSSEHELIMDRDSRVIAYRRVSGYYQSLAPGYFTSDINVLNAMFPDIFEEKMESGCNYFAKYIVVPACPLTLYHTLTRDAVLHITTCTYEKSYQICDSSEYDAMLICDDKEGTLRNNSFERAPIEHKDPNWICGGDGAPNREDIFF
jgi:hypothetical protein